VLDASGNNIQALPRQMSNNLMLAELLLENNRCTSIPPVVMELQGMTEFRLTSNRLLKIIDGLGNARKLQVLHLQHNNIKAMPPGMSRLFNLKILKMSHNSLIEVPGSFVKIRPLDDPPKHVADDNAQGTKQVATTQCPRASAH
jgi:Leucine-rich repeat (LRR) protein